MTSITDNIVNRRVLVDWDGDGYFNDGVLQSTPINQFPSRLYTNETYLRGFDSSFVNAYYADSVDTDKRGILKRSIRLGDEAVSIRFLWDDYKDYQPHVSDPTNLLADTAVFNFCPSGYISSSNEQAPQEQPAADNGLVGKYVGHLIGFTGYGIGLNNTVGANTHIYQQSGYHDVPERYSQAIQASSTSHTFAGLPAIVAGQTYTLVFYVYMPSYKLVNGYTSTTVKPRIYSNGGSAATPNFGRQDMGGVDFTLQPDTWTAVRTVFTAPVGATAFYLDLQWNNPTPPIQSVGMYTGGFMLFDGTVTLPTRFWDSSVTYQEKQFSFVYPADSNAYVLSYWVRSTNGITKLIPTKHMVNIGSNTITDTALSDINLTADWQRVNVAVAGAATRRSLWLTFTAEKSGVAVDPTHTGDVEFSGFMITEGSIDTYPYHAGTLYGYDDVTDYVKHLSTKSGKTNLLDALPSEGQASITLNNDDKRFSPSNASSPLYGYLKPNLKVSIQVWSGTAWVELWSGWTYQFDVTPGSSQTREATMDCQQGVYRLAEGALVVPVQINTSMDVLAKLIIENSGWRTPGTTIQSFVGIRTLVGSNAYTQDPTQLYSVVEEGINLIEVSGKNWSQNTDPRKALEDVLESENAQMFIGRDGKIGIYNRNHWIETAATDTFTLDTEVNKAEYEYGTEIVNSVDVTIVKNKQLQDQVVWETKRPIRLVSNQVWLVELNPTFSEGLHKTVISYTLDGMTKNIYIKDTGILNDTTDAAASQEEADNVSVELLGEAGARPRLRIKNNNAKIMWVSLSIKGDYLETGNGEITRVEDEASIEAVQGRHQVSYTSSVLTTEAQAESYGDFLMQHKSVARGDLSSFSIVVRNQADLDRVFALDVGDVVLLSEVQSAETLVPHAIIGEDCVISDSHTLTMTYFAARSLSDEFYLVDVSTVELDHDNYIPTDMQLASAPTNGGSFDNDLWQNEGLERIMVWNTGVGAGNKLVLAPSRDQLLTIHPLTGVLQHPATDSLGAVITNKLVMAEYPGLLLSSWGGQLPTGQKLIEIHTLSSPFYTATNAAKMRVYYGVIVPDGRDEAVSGTFMVYPRIATLPGAKYKSRLEAGYAANGQRIIALAQGLTSKVMAGWTGTSAHTGGTTFTTERNLYNTFAEISWRSTPNGAGQEDTGAMGFLLYEWTNDLNPALTLNIQTLRYSDYARVGGVFLDSTTAHKYTLYARTDPDSEPVNYTLTVIAEDGSTIGTDAHTVTTSAIEKFEVTIPSGNTSAWGYLTKTTDDYLDTRLLIYGFGITDASVTDYLELVAPRATEKVYA